MGKTHKIFIAGAGNIGKATGVLLREEGDLEVDLFIGDAKLKEAQNSAAWIFKDSTKPGAVVPFEMPKEGSSPELEKVLQESDILLDCLPGDQAPRMAQFAKDNKLHYANLTEYIQETEKICQIFGEDQERGYILQTGLAPGFINVLGRSLLDKFCDKYKVTTVENLTMRVGALTQHACPPHYYGVTWSAIGVATEYVKPASVIRDGRQTIRPSLSERAPIFLDGIAYEEAITSGGAADLPKALLGKVRTLDYKTLRCPGHYAWIEDLLAQAPREGDVAKYLDKRIEEVVPLFGDGYPDRVVIHVNVDGRDQDGVLRRLEDFRIIHPRKVGAHMLKAIQTTTAAGLAESARLLLTTNTRGITFQSAIDTDVFLNGHFVKLIYGEPWTSFGG